MQSCTTQAPMFKNSRYSYETEGLPRNASMHACGVIIAKSAAVNYIPQAMMEDRDLPGTYEPTTQFNMSECEECGLFKMDFLGLRTMGVINSSCRHNNKRRQEGKPELTYSDIPINDQVL